MMRDFSLQLVEEEIFVDDSGQVFVVYVEREEVEGIQGWICQIWNATEARNVPLKNGADEHLATTWQEAERWFSETTKAAS